MNLSTMWPRLVRLYLISVVVCLVGVVNSARAGDADALHAAALDGDTKRVSALIESGVDVNARTESGSYALNGAAAANEIEIIEMLLARGADPNVQNGEGDTPLICATKYAGGSAATVRILVEAGTDMSIKDDKGMTALDHAKAQGEQEAIVLLAGSGS